MKTNLENSYIFYSYLLFFLIHFFVNNMTHVTLQIISIYLFSCFRCLIIYERYNNRLFVFACKDKKFVTNGLNMIRSNNPLDFSYK